MTIKLPLKWHGGKYYLAKKIIALMPPHTHYVEPYAGGLAVLLAKDPNGISEVVNDINGQLINFWRVLRDSEQFAKFERIINFIPLSRQEWEDAAIAQKTPTGDPVTDAVNFFVLCRQSLAGRMKSFTPLTRSRTRRGMNGNVSEWLSAVSGLEAVHERLKRVVVENDDALNVIRREDGLNNLFYIDPPYLHETRTSKDVYQYEMTEQQHEELLNTITKLKAKVMISGYESKLYKKKLMGWNRHSFNLPNNAAGGDKKQRKEEIVWCNF